jgi:hypothetical protein
MIYGIRVKFGENDNRVYTYKSDLPINKNTFVIVPTLDAFKLAVVVECIPDYTFKEDKVTYKYIAKILKEGYL